MTVLNVQMTAEEIELLADLASAQLFRREFIDPKMPGQRCNRAELTLGKQVVERLQSLAGRVSGQKCSAVK